MEAIPGNTEAEVATFVRSEGRAVGGATFDFIHFRYTSVVLVRRATRESLSVAAFVRTREWCVRGGANATNVVRSDAGSNLSAMPLLRVLTNAATSAR
jgi:hypothetical protein